MKLARKFVAGIANSKLTRRRCSILHKNCAPMELFKAGGQLSIDTYSKLLLIVEVGWMKKSLMVVGLCASASLFAQGPPPGRGAGRMGMGPGGPGMMGIGRTVTGAPYSGQEVTEESQTLANGNVITRKLTVNVFRDGSGRVRTERTVPAGRPGMGRPGTVEATTSAQTPRTVINIHDPVAGVSSELDATSKTAHQMTIPTRGGGNGFGGGRGPREANGQTASADPNVVRETLPMQTINGVQATGTRVTRTIPAGQIGNSQPIQVITETWHSPDLKVPVMTKRIDPVHGNVTTQLMNITRSEPDPSLFQVPSDYTVTHGRGARAGNGQNLPGAVKQ